MKIKLNMKPLSVNQAWQGQRYKTKMYKAYEQEALLRLPNKKTDSECLKISYDFYLKHSKISDVGNFEKPLTDILVKKGIIKDDRYIRQIVITKYHGNTSYVIIKVEDFEEKK